MGWRREEMEAREKKGKISGDIQIYNGGGMQY
jgi:hypothetical protein